MQIRFIDRLLQKGIWERDRKRTHFLDRFLQKGMCETVWGRREREKEREKPVGF